MPAELSVVVPLFNEAKNVPALVDAVQAACASIPDIELTLWLVNDGSGDTSQQVIEALAADHACVRAVELSKNFGKEAALSAGLDLAEGDAVVFMDADLQHPPECIRRFVEAWRAGADVVVGIRDTTADKSAFRKAFGALYAWVAQRLSDAPAAAGETDFCLLDRKVVLAARALKERERIFRGLVRWLGFRRVELHFDASSRYSGVPSYTFGKLVNLAFRSFTSQSQAPLRAVLYVGVLACLASLGGLTWMVLAERVIDPVWHYTALAKALVFTIGLVGVLQVSLGVTGLYVAHIHQEALQRPLYVVRRVYGEDAS